MEDSTKKDITGIKRTLYSNCDSKTEIISCSTYGNQDHLEHVGDHDSRDTKGLEV